MSKRILPEKWDATKAAYAVMRRMVKVNAHYVKGAHDSEFVCDKNRAYIVSLVNDKRAGENPFWLDMYSTLSIVNMDTLTVERVIDFAKGGQKFGNVILPEGTCTVPRIIRKDKNTIRCYFASENPGRRQAQMWYRDFNLSSGEFEPNIYRAKIKTSKGTFDMQPKYFFEDANVPARQRNELDFGLFFVDSFKQFDGKIYVVINNFFANLNALALLHNDYATFEILGHYDKPYDKKLSESSVNRLPDGTWLAICRSEIPGGNYLFTFSKDGKEWTDAVEMPFVKNGDQSKPIFDRFNDVYYLGYQESTRIENVPRSIFNIDVSVDCIHWERKYRFESKNSFQYPTLHEHNGSIWMTVTQGDTNETQHAMYKERIMFGKLEDIIPGSRR